MTIMKRRAFFAALAGAAPLAASDPCPVGVLVEAGPSIHVTVPNMGRQNLLDVVTTFFGRGKPSPEMREAFARGKDITVTLTTKCQK